ncbi:MAG: PKD domain-containing protein [Candidatus Bathyarchaeota archaeon]|nr:PKD domain-containing protein [Candidatus Bathyarchaeota archaeon]
MVPLVNPPMFTAAVPTPYVITGSLSPTNVNYHTISNVAAGDRLVVNITSTISSGYNLGFHSKILYPNLTAAQSLTSSPYYPSNPHQYNFTAAVSGNYYLMIYDATSSMNYTVTSSHSVSSEKPPVLTPYVVSGSLPVNMINYHAISNIHRGDVVLLTVNSSIGSGYNVGFWSAIMYSNLSTAVAIDSSPYYPGNPHIYQFIAQADGPYYVEVYHGTSDLNYSITSSHPVSSETPPVLTSYTVSGSLPVDTINYHRITNIHRGDIVLLSVSSSIGSGYNVGFYSAILFSNLSTAFAINSSPYYPGNPHIYQFIAPIDGTYYLEVYHGTQDLNYTVTSSHPVSSEKPPVLTSYTVSGTLPVNMINYHQIINVHAGDIVLVSVSSSIGSGYNVGFWSAIMYSNLSTAVAIDSSPYYPGNPHIYQFIAQADGPYYVEVYHGTSDLNYSITSSHPVSSETPPVLTSYTVSGSLPVDTINYHRITNIHRGDIVLLSVSSSIGSGYNVGFYSAILFSNLSTAFAINSSPYYPGNPHIYQFIAPIDGTYYLEVYHGTSDLTYIAVSSHQVSGLVPAPVQSDFSFSPLSPQANSKVTLTDQSRGNPVTWQWNFGDSSTTSTQQNTDHTYSTSGDFTVTLAVTNAAGSTSTFSKPIHVSPAPTTSPTTQPTTPPTTPPSGSGPQADFTVSLQRVLVLDTVNFRDASTGNPTAWLWDFGDGQTSMEKNPSHVYQIVGTYTVTLRVSNEYGSDTATKQGFITVNPFVKPIAKFGINDVSPIQGKVRAYVGQTLQFYDLSESTATSWLWDFGDGTTSAQQNPTHIYWQTGNYTVALTVTNSAGSDTQIIDSVLNVASDQFTLLLSPEVNVGIRLFAVLLTGGIVLSMVRRSKHS